MTLMRWLARSRDNMRFGAEQAGDQASRLGAGLNDTVAPEMLAHAPNGGDVSDPQTLGAASCLSGRTAVALYSRHNFFFALGLGMTASVSWESDT